MYKNKIVYSTLLFIFGFLVSCKKEGEGTVFVQMTDAPGDYKQVNIDLKEVKVKINKDTGWVALDSRPGVYNLLDLRNGVDTLIASGKLPEGDIQEIRLILGSNNTVMLNDSTIHTLDTPSAEHSGFKIKLQNHLDDNENETIIIDFDAALSIKNQNGSYKLDPVLKVK